MNKAKHMKVDIVDEKTASDLINSPRFSTLDELGEDCYEVIIVYYFLGEIFLPAINFSWLAPRLGPTHCSEYTVFVQCKF